MELIIEDLIGLEMRFPLVIIFDAMNVQSLHLPIGTLCGIIQPALEYRFVQHQIRSVRYVCTISSPYIHKNRSNLPGQ